MKAVKILALAVLMVVMVVPFAGAQTITWNSSFTVVNLGTADATVDVTFYNEAGTAYHPDPLVPGTPDITNPFVLAPGASQIMSWPLPAPTCLTAATRSFSRPISRSWPSPTWLAPMG
jgi:hypothetical protein